MSADTSGAVEGDAEPRFQLREPVKVCDVPRYHKTSQPGRLCGEDGVILRLASGLLRVPEDAGHATGQDVPADQILRQERHDPMIRDLAQKGRDPAHHRGGILVSGIKISDQEAHLPQNDRRMEDGSRNYAGLDLLREPSLKLVDDHAGVEKNTFPGNLGLVKEVKIGRISQWERVLTKCRPTPPQNPVDIHSGSGL
jgi:hypothetical protein